MNDGKEFKIGDLVKVVKLKLEGDSSSPFKVGDYVFLLNRAEEWDWMVSNISPEAYTTSVNRPHGTNVWYFDTDQIEIVLERKSAQLLDI